ncbi:hypothetical protein [Nostoc sp. TCL240-02]|uniref:hypothetical protein n=1 Tax=Nostoc sp. TCL240-02 TaxID=2572090 RepID=UPI00157FAC7A|nr:hypothetical protein [Nostoc sp. TCL240-02]QKQ76461.1 hypothetical protein FBB35_27040 [Nostoc sp. TCL240-02]
MRNSKAVESRTTNAERLAGTVIGYLKHNYTVEQLFFWCQRELGRELTHEEFKTIASKASEYGYEIDVEKEYSKVSRKDGLESELKVFFDNLTIPQKVTQLHLLTKE